jgi:hypothetical protein
MRRWRRPRIAGPRCGDAPAWLCALCWQSPNETQAKRPRQSNRRAVGGGPLRRGGLRPRFRAWREGQARRCHGERRISKRLISEPCPVTGQKDKPRIAGPRGGDRPLRLSHFMAAIFARHIGSAQGAAKSPGRGCGPAMRGGLTPLIPRLVRGPSDAPPFSAVHHLAPAVHAFSSERARK